MPLNNERGAAINPDIASGKTPTPKWQFYFESDQEALDRQMKNVHRILEQIRSVREKEMLLESRGILNNSRLPGLIYSFRTKHNHLPQRMIVITTPYFRILLPTTIRASVREIWPRQLS